MTEFPEWLPDGPSVTWGLGLLTLLGGIAVTALATTMNLRRKIWNDLNQDVSLAYAGLTILALQRIRDLRASLKSVLRAKDFDPAREVVDPSRVREPANLALGVLDLRYKLEKRFKRLLWVGESAKWLASLALVVSIGTSVAYFVAYREVGLWLAGCGLFTVTVFGAAGLLISYAVLHARIEQAIELANSAE